MKLMLNGALTLGTLDGANVEIREEVGDENFFLFGLTADEVIARKKAGYRPREVYNEHLELREAMDLIGSGFFSPEDKNLFKPLVNNLLEEDRYLVLADFDAYMKKQEEVARAYLDQESWTRKCILNVARAGIFSSDRTIKQYAEEIWRVKQTPVEL
jgi:starch phosphorylase